MNNLVFPNQPVSYNHTLASSLTINLNHYLGIERITQFLNNQLLELRFNLKQKCNLIFNILLEGENLTNALKQIKQVQISHNLGLIGWIRDNYKFFINSSDQLGWWEKNFDFNKFCLQELNYLFNFQFSNQDHHFFGIPKKYYLTSLFLSTKHDSIVQDVPLFFTPIYLMVDVKFNVTIKKVAQHTFFYNNELLQSNLVNWKLPNFTNHQNPITYQQAVLQLMADNHLTKHDYCLENHDFIIHPKFHIGHLKYQFHLSQTTPFPLIPVNKYKVKTQQQAIVNTFKLPVEQKLFDFQSHKKIAYQAIRWINRNNLENLFFEAILQEQKFLVVSSSYDLLMDYFVLSSNPIKQLVFFNYDHGDNQSFFAQFQPFIDQLSPLLTTPISKKNEFQQLTPFINLELDSFSNLQNYQALYGLKSVSEQNLDQSLTLINDLGVSDRWSQWSKIAFKHCIEQNLKLNTLLAKAKLIANLNQTYHQFLTTYSYEAFWKNVAVHQKFLEEYDHDSVLKVLYYLSLYIQDHKFPKKVRFFSLTQTRYSQNELIFLYKLFYSAVYYRLFYLSQEELAILLDPKLINHQQLLALTNEKWLKSRNEYDFFIKNHSYNQTFALVYDQDKVKQNIAIVIDNYFLDLKQRVNSWDSSQKEQLKELFDNIIHKRYWNKINIFIDQYYLIIKELFPVLVFYNNDNHLLQKYYASTKFDQRAWIITSPDPKLCQFILQLSGNDMLLIAGKQEHFIPLDDQQLNHLIISTKAEKIVLNQTTNQKSAQITTVVDQNYLPINYNCDQKYHDHLGIKSFYVPPVFLGPINLGVIATCLNYLTKKLNNHWYQRNVILVPNEMVKQVFFAEVIKNKLWLKYLQTNDLLVRTLDQPINFWIDHLIILFNDEIPLLSRVGSGRCFYNENKLDQKILNYLIWTKQAVTNFISVKPDQILGLKNKNNRILLEKLLGKPVATKQTTPFSLVETINQEVVEWLTASLDHEKYQIQLMNLALEQNFIKITNNDHLVVLMIKVVYSNRSYEENQKITQSLINQRYRVFDLFLYDWMYKKTIVQQLILSQLGQKKPLVNNN